MSTTPSPLLLLLLLVASPLASSDPPTIPGCPQATCGDAKIDLYPFWLPPTANKTNSSSVCGYLGLDLICLDGNLTKRTPSAYYTILDIDKKARTLTVVDSARRESSCTRPLHNLTHDQIHPLHYAPGVVNYTFYFNCSSKLDRYIPCFADAGQGYSYLVAPGDVYREKLYDRCEYTVEVPVSEASPADAGYGDDVKAQFQLAWDEPDEECEDCERSGGRCAFKEDDRLGFTFSCRCDDAEHRKDCGDGNGGKGSKKKAKIGIGVGVGGFAGLLLMLACMGFLYRRHRKKQGHTSSLTTLFRSGSSEPYSFGKDPESLEGGYCKTPIFSYEELQEATGGFDPANELGDGGFGVVFKGKLKDGRVVAVKRLYERNYRRVKQFHNEVEILNRLRHHNLVALYGCTSSRECQELVLVYEYIPNGTVADHLHGPRAPERALTWPLRMTIAIEAADSLAYLHAHHPQIIHRDVKTSNILLDHSFTVKVGDFGLSRLFPANATHVSTAPQGTPGYVDPEYHQCYQLTDKSDVYSFGVVLVELISSKPAVDITRPRSEINLSNVAVDRIPRGLVGELVDPSLGFDEDPEVRRMVEQVAEVAFSCLQLERAMRPTMGEVRETLKDIAGVGNCTVSAGRGGSAGNTRDDACLLKSSFPPFSPNSVADKWISSRSTTPHASA